MEVLPDILKKLLCSVCGEYLSCAPVRMKNDGTALCGRCCDPEDESTLRITPYEHLAEMFLFPCANKTHGCTETLYMAEMKEHEEECVYRQYVCPVTESGQCDWSGARMNILAHCKIQHPDKLLQNPGTIQHQITVTSCKTFLLAAFQMLFIIHCKVCITSRNVYYSVRLIGKSVLATQYRYELEMSNSEQDTLTRKKDVAPQGCMSLQEDASVHVDFNTMLKFLGDFNHTIFKIEVGRKCVKCNKRVIESAWPTDGGWCCKDCAPVRCMRPIFNKGCTYTDSDIKANKHDRLFCQYRRWCALCQMNIPFGRDLHFRLAHLDTTYNAGTTWRAKGICNDYKRTYINSSAGKLLNRYKLLLLDDTYFELSVWSPLHTEQLSDYKCLVKLTNPVTGHTVRKTLPLYYSEQWDWQLIISKDEYSIYANNNEIDIQFDLIKNL